MRHANVMGIVIAGAIALLAVYLYNRFSKDGISNLGKPVAP